MLIFNELLSVEKKILQKAVKKASKNSLIQKKVIPLQRVKEMRC